MSEYPTAKESMKRGNLIHLNFLRKGITETHYYASVRSDGKFNLICIYSASEIGAILLVLMKLMLYTVRWILNLFQKDLGSAVFEELFDEINDATEALIHKNSLGSAITISYAVDSVEECLRLVDDHSKRHN